MDGLSGVLLEMQPLDTDRKNIAVVRLNLDGALADDRVLVLRDLIALREIGIEVILAVETRHQIDGRIQAKAGADRLFDTKPVEHRKHARKRCVDQRDVGVRIGAESGRSTRKQLGAGCDLGMDLEPHHNLPVACRSGNEIGSAHHPVRPQVHPSGPDARAARLSRRFSDPLNTEPIKPACRRSVALARFAGARHPAR